MCRGVGVEGCRCRGVDREVAIEGCRYRGFDREVSMYIAISL